MFVRYIPIGLSKVGETLVKHLSSKSCPQSGWFDALPHVFKTTKGLVKVSTAKPEIKAFRKCGVH